MWDVWSHNILHYHKICLVKGSLVVTTVVESQTYMDVIETDLFIKVEVEYIKIDTQQHFYFL